MSELNTKARIDKSWNVRKGLLHGILDRGDALVASLKLIPETREAITFDRWKSIVSEELEEAKSLYGNGEPLLSEQELIALAAITNPIRGW